MLTIYEFIERIEKHRHDLGLANEKVRFRTGREIVRFDDGRYVGSSGKA